MKLNELLNTVSPVAAILLTIEISLENPNFMEEANTLLPFLNIVTDYTFLTAKAHFIVQRFMNSLSQHIIDTRGKVNKGFMLFAMRIDPTKLRDIIHFENNRTSFIETLMHL